MKILFNGDQQWKMQCGGRDLSNDDEGLSRSENDAACGTRLICVHSPDCATPAAAAAPSPKIKDLGFGILQSISSHFVRRKILQIPKKSHPRIVASPPPLLRRARISAAHMTYLLLSVIVAPSISSRSENAAIFDTFCMIWFSSRIAADFCLTCTSLVQSALASDLRNDFPSSE